jgi:ankyrin repeat protein
LKRFKPNEASWSEQNIPNNDDNQSTSDDNDSTEAAHAAAIGHSPQPVKPSLSTESNDFDNDNVLKNNSENFGQLDVSSSDVKQKSAADGEANSDKMEVEVAPQLPLQPILESDLDKNPADELSMGKLSSNNIMDEKTPVPDLDENPTDHEQTFPERPSEKSKNGFPSDTTNVKKVRKLELDRTLNLNERDDDENTPLHIAIIALKLDHVKILLEAGASHRIRCDGSLPVHTAISVGALPANRQFAYECLVTLHEHGADLTVKDDAVHTPLYLACMFNLPQIVTYILSDDDGLSTLNIRADRAGNRPLHAAAKFDTLDNPSFGKAAASIATGQAQPILLPGHSQNQMDGETVVIRHSITGFSGKHGPCNVSKTDSMESDRVVSSTDALLTQVLLGTSGIEVDAVNVLGQTPLHIACMKRNWPVVRLLLQAGANPKIEDRRGHTPGHLCYKRAMPIPNDLYDVLGDPPETGVVPPTREFIVDPDASTLLIHHELCMQHHTCPPILRGLDEPPPENIRRLHVLVNPLTGILRSGEFGSLVWNNEARRASMADILKVSLYCTILLIHS